MSLTQQGRVLQDQTKLGCGQLGCATFYHWLGCRNCVLLRSFLDHVANSWLCKLRFSKTAPKSFAHLEGNTRPEISPWSTYLWPAAPSVCWQKYQLLIFPLLSRSGLVATATLPNFCFKFGPGYMFQEIITIHTKTQKEWDQLVLSQYLST